MKKYFIMAVTVLASLTACQQNEPEAAYNGEILFSIPETRVAMSEVTTENLGNFYVWGIANATTMVYEGTEVTRGTNNIWSPLDADDLKYWAADATYRFAAANITDGVTYANNALTINYTNTGAFDLIAEVPTEAETSNGGTGKEYQPLVFDHLLSQVAFTFEWAFPTNDYTFTVSDLAVLNAAGKAVATVGADGELNWGTYTDGNAIALDENTTIVTEAARKLTTSSIAVIPTGSYKLAFKVTINEEKVVDYTGENALAFAYTTGYVAGNKYTFNAKISAENLELLPIEFSSVTVTPWGDVDGGEIDFDQQ